MTLLPKVALPSCLPSFHRLDMTLAVAEALTPNKPKPRSTLDQGYTKFCLFVGIVNAHPHPNMSQYVCEDIYLRGHPHIAHSVGYFDLPEDRYLSQKRLPLFPSDLLHKTPQPPWLDEVYDYLQIIIWNSLLDQPQSLYQKHDRKHALLATTVKHLKDKSTVGYNRKTHKR